MKANQDFFISQPVDPFTLLKLFQLLEQMEVGGKLELVIEGEALPDKLKKMITGEAIEISELSSDSEQGKTTVTLIKLKSIYQTQNPGGDCCCS